MGIGRWALGGCLLVSLSPCLLVSVTLSPRHLKHGIPMPPLRLLVSEVHNFGGFFGGDTITLSGAPWPEAGEEQTLTIDEAALENVADRHTIVVGMLLELHLAGTRVDRALLLAAPDHNSLRQALG